MPDVEGRAFAPESPPCGIADSCSRGVLKRSQRPRGTRQRWAGALWRRQARAPVFVAATSTAMLSWLSAYADPHIVANAGLPVQISPTFQEPGLTVPVRRGSLDKVPILPRIGSNCCLSLAVSGRLAAGLHAVAAVLAARAASLASCSASWRTWRCLACASTLADRRLRPAVAPRSCRHAYKPGRCGGWRWRGSSYRRGRLFPFAARPSAPR